MRATESQLTLLDVPVSARGPARPPAQRQPRAAVPATLPLPLDASGRAAAVSALERAERFRKPVPVACAAPAAEPSAAEMVARALAQKPAPPPPPAAAAFADLVPDDAVFIVTDKDVARTRALLRAFSERVAAASLRRDGTLEAREGEHAFRARVDRRAVRVSFTDTRARALWLPALQSAARELGLVEPE